MRAENLDRCTPPLGEEEMEKLLKQVIERPGLKLW